MMPCTVSGSGAAGASLDERADVFLRVQRVAARALEQHRFGVGREQ